MSSYRVFTAQFHQRILLFLNDWIGLCRRLCWCNARLAFLYAG
jgi:hypothetical protein